MTKPQFQEDYVGTINNETKLPGGPRKCRVTWYNCREVFDIADWDMSNT